MFRTDTLRGTLLLGLGAAATLPLTLALTSLPSGRAIALHLALVAIVDVVGVARGARARVGHALAAVPTLLLGLHLALHLREFALVAAGVVLFARCAAVGFAPRGVAWVSLASIAGLTLASALAGPTMAQACLALWSFFLLQSLPAALDWERVRSRASAGEGDAFALARDALLRTLDEAVEH